MVNKRYQVFLSSTYEDLREERSAAILALLKLDCFPAGMELFPSSDDSVWQVIKKTIADSDYYVLIIAGRYGSISNDGVTSWTEREYNYAQEIGKPTFVFLYKDLKHIESGQIDDSAKVKAFREKVGKRFCVTCGNIDSLRAEITMAMSRAMLEKPGIGWVRANTETQATTYIPPSDTDKVIGIVEKLQKDKKLDGNAYYYKDNHEVADKPIDFALSLDFIFFRMALNTNLYFMAKDANSCQQLIGQIVGAWGAHKASQQKLDGVVFDHVSCNPSAWITPWISRIFIKLGLIDATITNSGTMWMLSDLGRKYYDHIETTRALDRYIGR